MRAYNDYLQLISERISEYYSVERVAEFKPPLHPLDERLIQCVWAEQMLQPEDLKTVSGAPVEVLNPGDWNSGQGPDFLDAEVAIDGKRRRGDVEVHLRSGDFRGHGHDRDYEYNNVVLHVFLGRTDEAQMETLHNGTQIERLELEPFLFPDLDTIRSTISPDEFPNGESRQLGKCQPIFADWDFDELKGFLDTAGRERLLRKTERLEHQRRGESLEQVFVQSLLVSMGLRGSRPLYFLLAKRTPVMELADYARDVDEGDRAALIEAIYFTWPTCCRLQTSGPA